MAFETEPKKRQEYATKLVLTSVFLALFAIFLLLSGAWQGAANFHPSVLDIVLLILATFRLGRMVAYDLVMEPFRSPVAQTVPDSTGEGDSVEAKGQGVQQALGQLISCPICSGTWVAAILVYFLYLLPGPAHIFLLIMGAIGGAEILNGAMEALCWSGQLNRTLSGERRLARQEREAVQRQMPRGEGDLPHGTRNSSPQTDYTWKADCEEEGEGALGNER